MPTNAPLNRKLRMGLVGGGQGAFIGRVHATAGRPRQPRGPRRRRTVVRSGQGQGVAPDYDIPADRAYGSYKEMIDAEAKRPPTSDRLRLRRHAEPHALRDRQGVRRGRLQRRSATSR